MKSVLVILFILGFLSPGWAEIPQRVLLVSDIDDTIKRSHIHELTSGEVLFNLEYSGMANLYNNFMNPKLGEAPRQIAYVTAALPIFWPLSRQFLKVNHFPAGSFHGTSWSEKAYAFKVRKITELVTWFKPTVLILIGDNAQADAAAFEEIRRRLKNTDVKVTSFVHQIYSPAKGGSELFPGQISWLTSADLAFQFFKQSWLTRAQFTPIFKNTVSQILNFRSDYVLPRWADCLEFSKTYSRPSIEIDSELSAYANAYEAWIQRYCREIHDLGPVRQPDL